MQETLDDGSEPDHVRRLADMFWRTLLGAAFVVLVLVFLYSTWSLARILEDLSIGLDTKGSPPPAISRAELNATIHAFDERKAQFEALKTNSVADVKDPSI